MGNRRRFQTTGICVPRLRTTGLLQALQNLVIFRFRESRGSSTDMGSRQISAAS